MKKLLLFAALAATSASINAAAFTDYFSVTCEGEAVTNGQTITVNTYYDPIIKDYPELKDDPTWEWNYSSEVRFEIKNVTDATANLTGILSREEPAISAEFPSTGSALGWLQICSGINCGDIKNDVCITPDNAPVDASTIYEMDIHHNDFTSLTPVVGKLVLKTSFVEDFVVYINFTNQSDITLAVDGIEAESGAEEYYTLQGVKVTNPEKGQIYIVRNGSKVSKRLF